jgi:SAM-dependent methyltransferase
VISSILYKYLIKSLRSTTKYYDQFIPKKTNHEKWQSYIVKFFDKPGYRVLDIGSRKVTKSPLVAKSFKNAEYVGFDIKSGNNVDIVGDAHQLTSYFEETSSFDLVLSSATFEHFHSPWFVANEIIKMTRLHGHIFVESHFSFGVHERPSHFFHFTDHGLERLFCYDGKVEIIESGLSNPLISFFSNSSAKYLKGKQLVGLFAHCEFFGRKINNSSDKESINSYISSTMYPR